MGDYNHKCPFCGEETLFAIINVRAGDVLLGEDGFSDMDAKWSESEIEEVRCHSCNREVDRHHYFSHADEPCDCVEVAAAAGSVTRP